MTKRLWTLRSRLALRAFVVTLLALIVLLVVGGMGANRILEESAEASAKAYLATVVAELEIADGPSAANVAVLVYGTDSDFVAQIISQATGEILHTSTDGLDTALVDPRLIDTGQEVMMVVHPSIPEHRIVLAARAVEVDGISYAVLAGAKVPGPLLGFNGGSLMVLFAAVLISAGVAAGAWASARSALRPVEELAKEADLIAKDPSLGVLLLESHADTAEIDRLIGCLNSLLFRVHESQERERAFLDDASHDLRTPIAVARAELDLASSTLINPETKLALDSAIEELDRLDRLTADLLILAKMRSEPSPATEPVHLGHLVKKTAARMARDPQQRDVNISVEGVAEVRGDPLTLERAVANILTNSIRHAATSIDVDIFEQEEEASIRVHDDGSGFSAPMLARASRRFARDTNDRNSTGLGLAIASAIAIQHGGSLDIGNHPEGGAEVTLHLPTTTDPREREQRSRGR